MLSVDCHAYLSAEDHAEGVVIKNNLKYLENIGLTKHILRVAQKAALLPTRHIARKFRRHSP